MRILIAIIGLAAASCSVDSDRGNEQITLEYNEQQARDTAAKAGQTAKNFAAGVGNVAEAAGSAIKNEVGSIDVDVNVNRTAPPKPEPR